ncbi:hypothetical protein ACFXKC_09010 [Streptomyces sp. NPDC059340]|uniref:hypothetical protein n=1 Tax=Streptomyces sp. NPDC059340 TaxID=3346806 RepID=UPI0036C67F90
MTIPTRVDRACASAGIAMPALQQIEDDLTGEIGAQEIAEILRDLHHQDHRQDGVFGSLTQLLTVAAQAVVRIERDRDGEMSCPLREAERCAAAWPARPDLHARSRRSAACRDQVVTPCAGAADVALATCRPVPDAPSAT